MAASSPSPRPSGFDRVASAYIVLERLVFGRALERARRAQLRDLPPVTKLGIEVEPNWQFRIQKCGTTVSVVAGDPSREPHKAITLLNGL